MPDQTEDLNINTLRKLNQTRAAFLEDISCYQFTKLSSQTTCSLRGQVSSTCKT